MTIKPLSVKASIAFAVAVAALIGARPLAPAATRHPFRTQMLDGGANETAAVADINRDSRLDIVSGENWFEADLHPTAHRTRGGGPSVDRSTLP